LFDWTGNFYQYCGVPLAYPGDQGLFIGYAGPGNVPPGPPGTGVPGTIGPSVQGLAMVSQLVQNWNWLTNDIITVNYQMVGKDELFSPPDLLIQDPSHPKTNRASECAPWVFTPYQSDVNGKPLGIEGTPFTLCLQQATLTVTANAKEFANSCTGGWKSRIQGPFDWNLAIVLDEADIKQLKDPTDDITFGLRPGMFVGIDAFVNNIQAWGLEFGIVQDFTNYKVNIETGDIISYTVNILMSTDTGVAGSAFALGTVLAPDGRTIWPIPGAVPAGGATP
jgi:hypothetical protein